MRRQIGRRRQAESSGLNVRKAIALSQRPRCRRRPLLNGVRAVSTTRRRRRTRVRLSVTSVATQTQARPQRAHPTILGACFSYRISAMTLVFTPFACI